MWGVSPTERRQIGKWTGWVALASTAELSDGLLRFVSIDSPYEGLPVSSTNVLTEGNGLEDAAIWFRSPHLHQDTLEQLSHLTREENLSVEPRMAELARIRAKLREDLDAMDRARQAAWNDPDFYKPISLK